jgi:hypothetical protein
MGAVSINSSNGFPGVTMEQVRAVLDHAAKSLNLPQVA